MLNGDSVLYSRILTEMTLAFHIIYATIGVGVPLMIALAHFIGIKKKDNHFILLARRWTRGFVITVAVGVVTGTSIGIQLNLLWPSFMEVAGQVISLPLFLETFAFFFEAIFLGIYIYTWDRFKNPMKHFMLLVPVVIGAAMSAVFITMVNAFMNTPQGFELKDGILVNIEPLIAMFNPATPTKTAHVLTSAFMTSAFILASIAAVSLLKGRKHPYYRKALHLTMVVALVFSIATAVVGDLSGKFLAKYQPEKLAAAEWHFETKGNAPLVFFGSLDENSNVKNAIVIPNGLSFLAKGSISDEVIGLDKFPNDEHPPLYIHHLFNLMIAFGMALTALAACYYIFYKLGWNPYRKLLLLLTVISGPIAMLTIEIGWIFAEVGRQPWILRGFMKTYQGATTSDHVGILIIIFGLLYITLGTASVVVLRKLFKHYTPEKELAEQGEI